jgi:hypothetical protein
MLVLVARRSLLIVAFVVESLCFLAAQGTFPMPLGHAEQDTKSADVRELVSKYCRLDYDAARLDGQGWAKIEPLVSWKTNPEYTEINVIARYTVDPEPTSSHAKYTVTVHYRLLGTYNLTTGYVPEAPNAVQDVQFTVTDTNGDLRISDSENNLPHPSRAAMLKWLNGKLSATQDEHAKMLYQEALRQLQAQPASPFAK